MKEVRETEVRPIEQMLDKDNCPHRHGYRGSTGFWYCVDCPEFAYERTWFDGRTEQGAKWPKDAHT